MTGRGKSPKARRIPRETLGKELVIRYVFDWHITRNIVALRSRKLACATGLSP